MNFFCRQLKDRSGALDIAMDVKGGINSTPGCGGPERYSIITLEEGYIGWEGDMTCVIGDEII